jgi:hypothetical protein
MCGWERVGVDVGGDAVAAGDGGGEVLVVGGRGLVIVGDSGCECWR